MTSPFEQTHDPSTQNRESELGEKTREFGQDELTNNEPKPIDSRESRLDEIAAKLKPFEAQPDTPVTRQQLRQQNKGKSSRVDKPVQAAESDQGNSKAESRKKERNTTKKLKVRVFPIWMRLIIILVLCGAALIGGAMVGYGIIGKGNPLDVLHMETWTHIRDIVYAKK